MDAVANQVLNVDAPIAGEIISNMYVQRGFEGAPVSFCGQGGTTGL